MSARMRRRVAGTYRPLLVVLVLGTLIRAIAQWTYFPAVMTSADAPRFARVGPLEIFGDFWMPAGYPAFLKVLHAIDSHVWFSIVVQHLLGVALGVVVYATARRIGATRPIATAASAVLLLSGDAIFLEHQFMADSFLFAMVVLAFAAAVRGLVPRLDLRWLFLAGVLGMCAMLTRNVGVVSLVAIALTVLIAGAGPLLRRTRAVAVVLVGALVVLGGYVGTFEAKDGQYLGLTDMSGWNLYSRVAPFAECSKFDVPQGAGKACDPRPPSQRPGPFGYVWDLSSISRTSFTPLGPDSGKPLGEFAKEALVHQPGDYLHAVGSDLLRYVEPSVGENKPYSGQGRELVSFAFRVPDMERAVESALDLRYEGTHVSAPGAHALGVYQNVFRVDRLLLAFALLLAVAGFFVASGPLRIGVLLFGLGGLGLYVLPVLTVSYDFRYGVPPGLLISVAAILSAQAFYDRARSRGRFARERPTPPEAYVGGW